MSDELATNPVAGGEPAPGVAADDAAGAVQPETEAEQPTEGEAGDGQAPEDDGEEIEHDGEKFRVPAKLKEAFLRQQDYTRKTQEVADQRRAVEADQARVQQMDTWAREHAVEFAQLVNIDQQLAQYQRVDWDAWEAQDPLAAQRGWRQFQQLKDARSTTADNLRQRDAAKQAETERSLQDRLSKGRAQLAKEIPGWGPQMQETLTKFGMDNGLTRDELDNVVDPRLIRILHRAYVGEQIIEKQRAAAKQTQPAAVPAQPVTVIGTRKSTLPIAASSPASDRLSNEEWNRRRDAELAAKAKRH